LKRTIFKAAFCFVSTKEKAIWQKFGHQKVRMLTRLW
jgi:hypothetical protein